MDVQRLSRLSGIAVIVQISPQRCHKFRVILQIIAMQMMDMIMQTNLKSGVIAIMKQICRKKFMGEEQTATDIGRFTENQCIFRLEEYTSLYQKNLHFQM